ncbi:4-hydroxythreonine-4-phosphate dehydrogenase PdxA [Brevibacterium antiquum]|uniref:4-hydroxythreonine-4-phosphate dehydrogenase PdxA n=1 Tax=Brevibacterium antiquum TaxID=234835 RepID=UPI001E29ABD9|nr:4-hydroxythreonine-4-phosphate dehydrogenase PdxA [Brevibacterium antiquum]
MMPDIPRIVLVPGDLSGVGPELMARLLADPANRARARLLVTATAEELDSFAATAAVTIADRDGIEYLGTDYRGPAIPVGEVSIAAGERALADLATALDLCAGGEADAVMFLPLNKGAMGQAGMTEEDELRWFAKRLDFDGFTSELNFIESLVTARVTSHVPVSEIAGGISAGKVLETIELLNRVVAQTRTSTPRLAVCALNPHAGEGGKFGREEIDDIAPAIELARSRGIDVEGPFPCDTLFARAVGGDYDGVVTMYHDQGQIAMKLLGFDQGVTVHGGIPVPIATPAHGTAHNIVGTGKADLGPSTHAFDLAVRMAESRRATADTGNAVAGAGATAGAAAGAATGVQVSPR